MIGRLPFCAIEEAVSETWISVDVVRKYKEAIKITITIILPAHRCISLIVAFVLEA